ncbi:MAG: hypothetical protein ABJE47_23715 [bacterium]
MRSVSEWEATRLVRNIACATIIGCASTSAPDHTSELAPIAVARIEGVATTSTGQPLDSVIANIQVTATHASEFGTEPGFSTADGRFHVNISRVKPTANTLDTITVTFVAAASQVRFRKADGSLPLDTTKVQLHLLPTSTVVPVVTINPRLPVP